MPTAVLDAKSLSILIEAFLKTNLVTDGDLEGMSVTVSCADNSSPLMAALAAVKSVERSDASDPEVNMHGNYSYIYTL